MTTASGMRAFSPAAGVQNVPDMAFRDRADAGRRLATSLSHLAGAADVVVLGLARGGVPVAYEVATALGAPLDVLLARKLGVPGQPELAMGALASGGLRVLNRSVIDSLRIPADAVEQVAEREAAELARREELYRPGRPQLDVGGKVAVVVDDGLATGATMRAAIAALRAQSPARLIAAVPVGSAETCADVAREADELVCLRTPASFHAVGQWYDDFTQVTDDEIRALLAAPTGKEDEHGQ
ncbi:MAG TPA: phosphoribosyltransferase [Acidimicrobiales bacterium]|nr:phosphoribosyltransferase [Acidimicrobiales bacterium]